MHRVLGVGETNWRSTAGKNHCGPETQRAVDRFHRQITALNYAAGRAGVVGELAPATVGASGAGVVDLNR